MNDYSYVSCSHGELFGLPCSDLTNEQLDKISTEKMIEFLPSDPRVQPLLSARMIKDTEAKELDAYKHLDEEDWKTYTLLRAAYNELLTATNLFAVKFNDSYSYRYRANYIFWPALNNELKLREIQQFLAGQSSVATPETIDYAWIDSYRPELSKEVMRFIVARECSSYDRRATLRIITTANTDILKEMEGSIFKLDKVYQLRMLSNPNTPEEWLDGLLRIYAKRIPYNVPDIHRALSHNVLAKLPPITRLEVMERLVYKSSRDNLTKILPDIKTSEDFRELLFGALTRHSDRVIKLIKDYNRKVGIDNEL
jgi:hypothetical protein